MCMCMCIHMCQFTFTCETKALLRKLANFFGEDPNVAKPDMILGRVADLLDKL